MTKLDRNVLYFKMLLKQMNLVANWLIPEVRLNPAIWLIRLVALQALNIALVSWDLPSGACWNRQTCLQLFCLTEKAIVRYHELEVNIWCPTIADKICLFHDKLIKKWGRESFGFVNTSHLTCSLCNNTQYRSYHELPNWI